MVELGYHSSKLCLLSLVWKNKLPENFILHKFFFFRSVVLIFLEGASRSPENRLADPSLRTTDLKDAWLRLLWRALEWCNKGVTRLDWRPHVRTWGFSEANVLLKKVLATLLGLFGAPRSDSAPGELCPPSSRPWCTPSWISFHRTTCVYSSAFIYFATSVSLIKGCCTFLPNCCSLPHQTPSLSAAVFWCCHRLTKWRDLRAPPNFRSPNFFQLQLSSRSYSHLLRICRYSVTEA